jgi:outer membrane immunogenic protein
LGRIFEGEEMMLKATLGAVALCTAVTIQGAFGADMPVKAPAPAPVVAVFSWTGFYIGGHVGWGWGDTDSTVLEATNTFFPQGTVNPSSFDGLLGGGQIGFNYQTGQFVFGVEAEGTWGSLAGDSVHTAVLLANREARTHIDGQWMVTLAGRFGVAVGTSLFYVKGGAAWADLGATTNSINTLNGAIGQTVSGSETRSGWIIGGGLEHSFGGNWSAKIEYNFLDFGTSTVTRSGTNFLTGLPVSVQRDADTQIQVVKFGINYRFGATPGVARY